MPRTRLLDPGFFIDEELAALPPLTRLLFAGLWTLADRAGRLADKPNVIKLATLPWDDTNIDQMLDDLDAAGFIDRYRVDGRRYIQVSNFAAYQKPHQREAASEIPPCPYDLGAPKANLGAPKADQGAPDETSPTGRDEKGAPRRPVSDPDSDPDPDPDADSGDAPTLATPTPPAPVRGGGQQFGRLFIHRWQVEHFVNALGAHAAGFELDKWLLDVSAQSESLVLAGPERWTWLQAQFAAEVARRGLPVATAPSAPAKPASSLTAGAWEPFVCPHEPSCSGRSQCSLRSRLDAARAEAAAAKTEVAHVPA